MKKLLLSMYIFIFTSVFPLAGIAQNTYVWISNDNSFHNAEAYYREQGVPAANIFYGGSLADAWCHVSSNGDRFIIVAHGSSLRLETYDDVPHVTTYQGGIIKLNGTDYAGFKRQGSNDPGTNSPCEGIAIFELPAKQLSDITVQIWACWGGKIPTIVQGGEPWQNGKSVAQTMDEIVDFENGDGSVTSPQGIFEWGACVNFDCDSAIGEGTGAWTQFTAALEAWAQQQGYEEFRDMFDATPYDSHSVVIQKIRDFCTQYNSQHSTNYTVNQQNPVDYSITEQKKDLLFSLMLNDTTAAFCGFAVDEGRVHYCAPTLTEWGVIILVVLIVVSTWVVLKRRKVIGVR